MFPGPATGLLDVSAPGPGHLIVSVHKTRTFLSLKDETVSHCVRLVMCQLVSAVSAYSISQNIIQSSKISRATVSNCTSRTPCKMPAHQQINDLNSECRSGTNEAPLRVGCDKAATCWRIAMVLDHPKTFPELLACWPTPKPRPWSGLRESR